MKEFEPRFTGSHINNALSENPDAPVLHVEVDKDSGRDRFGNRVFRSPELSYQDREGEEVKSALLVTQLGENLVRSFPRILKDISTALEKLSPKRINGALLLGRPKDPVIDLGNGRRVLCLAAGSQSIVYLLEVPGAKYILKTHLSYSQVHQPYINEMLQVQSLEEECGKDLETLGVAFPRFLFASGQMICTEYVPKEAMLSKDFEPTYYAVATTAEHAAARQKQGKNSALWKNVLVDKIHRGGVPRANFREREDGTLVWIDPIAYFPSGDTRRPEIVLSADERTGLKSLSVKEMRDEYRAAAVEVGMFHRSVTNFDSSTDDAWVKNAWEQIRHYGVDSQNDPDHIPFAMSEVKHKILKSHNIEWMIEK